ncbi:MAG TPA: MBL fold metallo-hydrolase [Actinomycetales bacterium]|nr:MBL fold metallo-hydrolase [Actinomycetales bacterium]
MRAATLTFLGGTHTVGGVQIVARTDQAALVFDLGVVGNPGVVRETALFHELMSPRASSPLADYLRAGMAPLLEGVYDDAQLPAGVARLTEAMRRPGHALAGREVLDLTGLDSAVFVSHLHDDHAGLARFVAPGVPLLMSEVSSRLLPALVEAGELVQGPATPQPLRPAEPRSLGDLLVEAVPVDHDVVGASGLLVTTPDGTFAYTGDWRGHGAHPERMMAFAERCRGVDVLMTDASCTGHTAEQVAHQVRETDVAPWFADVLRRTSGTAYLAVHPRNLERHEQLRQVTVAAGRRVVLDPVVARLWTRALAERAVDGSLDGVSVWDVGDDRPVPSGLPRVTPSDIAAARDAFVAHLPTRLRPLLLDAGAGPGDTFVHLNGHPFGSADPHWRVLHTWTRLLGLKLEVLSSHGHALPDDLAAFVDAVRPGSVVPVHTNAPDRFPRGAAPVLAVAAGTTVPVSQSTSAGASV